MLLRPHTLRPLALRALSCLLIVALLTSSLAPASAQDGAPGDGNGGGSLFLPLVSGGEGSGGPIGSLQVYRTDITVNTPAHWQTLERIGPVVLARGDNWAQVLVDDEQLADLARLRFNPEGTNALTTLQRAAAESEAPLPGAVLALAGQVQAAAGLNVADSGAVVAVRAALRAQMAALGAAELAAVAAAAGADADNDGLTDDQEFFWCTVSTRADTDYDQVNDGVEVARLKAWINNETFTYPRTNGTSTPFLGWPRQISGCTDSDKDSVPDLAEINELGLSAQRESTDRDKFDDGQELFGITDCTGEGGFCSYGPLPRNEDWGVIFAEMPAWVESPGDHPLVGAFPLPKLEIVPSSMTVERVTTITTEKGEMQQKATTYSDSVTTGTSSSIADTETWNNWTEVSVAKPTSSFAGASLQMAGSEPGQSVLEWRWGDLRTKIEPKIDLCIPVAKIFIDVCFGEIALDPVVGENSDVILPPDLDLGGGINFDSDGMKDALKGCRLDIEGKLICEPIKMATTEQAAEEDDPTTEKQDRSPTRSGREYVANGSVLSTFKTYPMSAPIPLCLY